jgi:cytochrome b
MKLKVWDLPTRLFHWLLFIAVVAAVLTAEFGQMVWHFRIGYFILALLAFRVIWGLVGGYWSRFVNFIYAPSSILAYLRGTPKLAHTIGHSPIGALSVFGLLLILIAQVLTGLGADDEIANAGPLTKMIPNAWVAAITWYHKTVGKWGLIALVSLHVIAVLFYLKAKKNNLIKPMLHGFKDVDPDAALPAAKDGRAQRILALIVFACGVGLAWWVSRQ